MLKVPRFMKEYANYRKEEIKNHVINDELKACSIEQINKAVKCYERGLFTVEETIEMITKA